ncbi:MAG: hypothetical protein ABI689_18325 [Thermoanaerobaculia bacterium]
MSGGSTLIEVQVSNPADQSGATVAAAVRRLLQATPSKYLTGLDRIAVADTTSLSRSGRRRHEKLKNDLRLATYFRRQQRIPPGIEMYSDAMSRSSYGNYLRFPIFRDVFVARVVFHEIGHHIAYEIEPRHDQREEVANVWARWLSGLALNAEHPILFPFLKRIMRRRRAQQ